MRDLIAEREEAKIVEQRQISLLKNFIGTQRERFEFAEISQHLAMEKNLEDTMVLNDALVGWLTNPKIDAKRKAELNDLVSSLWRVMAYCSNLETVSKTAVSKYIITEKRNDQLVSEKRSLELKFQKFENEKNKEIDALKKEIEFLNKP